MTGWQAGLVVVGLVVLGLAALASSQTTRARRERERRGWAMPIIRKALDDARRFDEGFAGVERLLGMSGERRDELLAEVARKIRRELLDPEYCAFCDGPCQEFAGHAGADEVRYKVLGRFGRSPVAPLKTINCRCVTWPDPEIALRAQAGDALARKLDAELLGLDGESVDLMLAFAPAEAQVAELERWHELDPDEVPNAE